jgi:nicotinate-nucleotide adenylyltransferase
MRVRRIGVLGGMFDPPHQGHLDVGAAAERALALTGMRVVPSHIPPHRAQPLASGYHRFAMTAMAIAGRPGWQALDVELRQASPSYTADTLRWLHVAGYQPSELFFLTGADAFAEIATWKDYPALFDLAHFAVVTRPGMKAGELPARLPALAGRMRTADIMAGDARDQPASPLAIFLIDAPTTDVSSTAVREALRWNRPLAGLVPPSVAQHIKQHDLYRGPAAERGAGATVTAMKSGRLHGED